MKKLLILCGILPLFLITNLAWAGSATCNIQIEDVNKATKYSIEHEFIYEPEGRAQRKHFEIPGNDYLCTLMFHELNNGTMLSCEYRNDGGLTFFQSDRTVLKDKDVTNNLSFRHKSAFISIKTKCE